MDIRYIHMSSEEYDAALSSGNLPDIVATRNNLSTILENGVALDVDPYLEEYVPNFLQGAARLTYDVYKQLGMKGTGSTSSPSGSDTTASASATAAAIPAAIFSDGTITPNWATRPLTMRTITWTC